MMQKIYFSSFFSFAKYTELRIVYRPEHYDQKEMGKQLNMIPNRLKEIKIVSNERETTTEESRRKEKQQRMNRPKSNPETVAHERIWRIFTCLKQII